jgi:hypothetical protein
MEIGPRQLGHARPICRILEGRGRPFFLQFFFLFGKGGTTKFFFNSIN